MPLGLFAAMSMTLLLLFGFLFAILAAVGYYFAWSGYLTVGLAVLLVLFQWAIGPAVIRWTTNMRPLARDELPWLQETVRELCRKHRVPMPKLAIARMGAPNAFVFGRTPRGATLVVTQGLLNTLSRDEVRAVVGHEVGHIRHKDMVVMTLASAIPIIAYFVARSLIFAPSRGDRRAGVAIAIGLGAFLVYFVTNLLVLYLSRLREYYSDHFSGVATRPDSLASALAKITYGLSVAPHEEKVSSAARYFYISDPSEATGEVAHFAAHYRDLHISREEVRDAMAWERRNPLMHFMELFRTHPLTYKRIGRLHELGERAAG